jgi:hypothetical protein
MTLAFVISNREFHPPEGAVKTAPSALRWSGDATRGLFVPPLWVEPKSQTLCWVFDELSNLACRR